MDRDALAELKRGGVRVNAVELLRVPIAINEQGQVVTMRPELPIPVLYADQVVWLPLKPISQLWTGSAVPPSLSGTPPPKYQPFFFLIEVTAAEYCAGTGQRERDEEFMRLYRHLRRRPDGEDANPLFSYLQAAARLYLSVRDVSRAEFEAVAHRLSHSAKTFRTSVDSTNYYDLVLEGLLPRGEAASGLYPFFS